MTDPRHRPGPLSAALVALALVVGWPLPGTADQHDDDALIGQAVYDQLKTGGQIVTESHYVPVLRSVGAKIEAAAQPHWFNERFYVIRGNAINAFSAPGGFVFVNEGLLRTINNADELANVLGHETAHLVLGHVQARSQVAQQRETILGGLALVLGQKNAGKVTTVANVSAYSFLNFSRQQEYAADELGAKLAAQAGYNPWGAVWFFKQLERVVGDAGYEQYVQEHPSTDDRIGKIEQFLHDNAATYARWKDQQPPTTGL